MYAVAKRPYLYGKCQSEIIYCFVDLFFNGLILKVMLTQLQFNLTYNTTERRVDSPLCLNPQDSTYFESNFETLETNL